jgi:uncharacterized protein
MPGILFDIGHPAHVHLFKNPRKILIERGWNVFVLARDKEVTRTLLEDYGIEYIPGTKKRSGISSFVEFIEWYMVARKVINEYPIHIVASIGSPAGAWAAKLSGIPHLAFNDTETALSQRLFYKPASTHIYTPSCLLADFGPKQIRYHGTHDLAYLRPEWFTPDISVRNQMGLMQEEPYVILRFVSWEATHDWARKPMATDFKRTIVSIVKDKYRLFISAEGYLPPDLEQYRLRIRPCNLHDAMAFASAVVGDGSTTITEAAALGVPALYISPFAGSFGVIEFYKKYGLLSSSKSQRESINILQEYLRNPATEDRKILKSRMLSETIDVACYIADQCELTYQSMYQHDI